MTIHSRRARRGAPLLASVLALALSACGGGGGDEQKAAPESDAAVLAAATAAAAAPSRPAPLPALGD